MNWAFSLLFLFIVVFSLYSINLEVILYPISLSAFLTSIVVVFDFTKFYKQHRQLSYLKGFIETSIDELPYASNLIEADYQQLLNKLFDYKNNLALQADSMRTDLIDYFTLWAHQIKTPIAAMRLLLQSEQSHQLNSDLMMQLSTIEQYVEMVLGYLRIESTSSDFVFKKYNLSEIVKQAIRKYSYFFINKNIKLEFQEVECMVLTDEKWFLFIVEQILFNALKYTQKGKITIAINAKKKLLTIQDTGIGILNEDLPRIFEKGFTGYNGRMDKKATGIGLYLCKKVLDKLSHKISITSEVDVGTKVKIDLSSTKTIIE